MFRNFLLACSFLTFTFCIGTHAEETEDPVSFARDIRPLLAEKCFGCHQPTQNRGGYVMTDFDRLVGSGDSGEAAIVAGNSVNSHLMQVITSDGGQAEMPPTGEPFSASEVALIKRWIDAGAENDFVRAGAVYSQQNPPIYASLPVVAALDVSPNGRHIAVSGLNEVLVFDLDGVDLAAGETPALSRRFIGLSSRIESVEFSPDSTKLAVSGGVPGELGEIQIWSVEDGEQELSKVLPGDTLYGVAWSPDGQRVSFGCTDTSLRAIDIESGEQVLYQGAHEDWVRDTVFSVDGSQLVSVGRDMSCKLVEVPTQRFVDNITSITPGALKGGIASVARHPERDEVIIGGSDGIPKIYRMNRLTKRVIGDDANLIRRMPAVPGRIQSVAVSADGRRFCCGSSLDGAGAVVVFAYDFDTSLPDEIRAIVSKRAAQYSKEEKQKLEAYVTDGVRQVAKTDVDSSGIYAVDFHPGGTWIAAGGMDGKIRVVDAESGQTLVQWPVVDLASTVVSKPDANKWVYESKTETVGPSESETVVSAQKLIVSPTQLNFHLPIEYAQFVVQAELADGSKIDVTQACSFQIDTSILSAGRGNDDSSHSSLFQPIGNGETEIIVGWKDLEAKVAVTVDLDREFQPDFVRDVNPVLTKLGCNAGTCHGSQGGKKGFKLSLRGYDPLFDIRAFTDDMACRRVNLASPQDSLMLIKPSTQVAHEGGKLIQMDGRYYHLIRDWIANGAQLDLDSPRVASIEVLPRNPMLLDANAQQQVRVVATYSDGKKRDVTQEAVVELGDLEVASIDGSRVTAMRRGESAILARFEGAYDATMLTVMGDRNGFVWKQPDTWGPVDELVSEKWKRMKIVPSGLCTDAEFVRRVYLDLIGLPPTSEQLQTFIQDQRDAKIKRDELIDQLIGSPDYVEHWANKWADLLQVNRKYLGAEGAVALRGWIRERIESNQPYDEFVHEILTATGSNRENPPASYYKIHRTPEDLMENTTHLFLATRFNCNKCHDHPFEKWTQDQYYETAAFFAQINRKRDPASKDRKVAGTAVESAKPLFEIIEDASSGEVTHERTGMTTEPEFPFDCEFELDESSSRREKLAAWLTSGSNPYFAKSYVNRVWGYLTGTGLIEPLDDIRAGNPASNPELLDLLEREFIESEFNTQHLMRMICKSRTYQLSINTNAFNADDGINYSHAKARRLPAEVLFDAIHRVTGSPLRIPGVEAGIRAAALPDSGVKLPSGFLSTLGRPARESACECERSNDLQLGSVLALVSGPDVSKAIHDRENAIATLVKETMDDSALVDKIYRRVLNRPASETEIAKAIEVFGELESDHAALDERVTQLNLEFEEELPGLKRDRQLAIDNTQSQLEQSIEKLDPELLTKEAKHAENLAAAEKAVTEYEESAAGFGEWKHRQLKELQWHPLAIDDFEAKSKLGYEVMPDRSVFLESKKGNDVYTITTSTDIESISAIRLELISDARLPANGPGLAPNGNLVLTELTLEAARPDQPDDWIPIELENAIANVEQGGYPVDQAIDGKAKGRQGWAVGNAIGETNWATFQLKLPTGFSGGTRLRVKLFHDFDDQHKIGRFRLAVTKYPQSTGLGLSEELIAQLSNKKVSKKIRKKLKLAFEKGDPVLLDLKKSLADAKVPLTIAPEIVSLRQKLDRVSQPITKSQELIGLESDLAASQQQLENHRLTVAQDLTWALINSPSFLFNR